MSHGLPTQPASVFQARRLALAERLEGRPALLFSGISRPRNYAANVFAYRPDSHFLYLTGLSVPGSAVLVHGERSTLYTPPFDPQELIWHGKTPSFDDIKGAAGVSEIRPVGELDDALKALGKDAVGTLPAIDPVTRFRQGRQLERSWAEPGSVVELNEGDGAVADAIIGLRATHDAAAIEMLKASAQGSVAAHRAGMVATKPGVTESTIRAAMEGELIRRGMEPAYGSIVTVHGEILHCTTYDGELQDGELVLADVGGDLHGWATDITRTWPVNGKFSPTQKTIYEIVLQSQLDAIAMVKPGARYRDVHLRGALTIAQGLVDEGILTGEPHGLVERGAHAIFFTHGMGHLLGLDVHDMEDLGDRAGYAPGRRRSDQFGLCFLRLDRDLEAGMAVTIEPGFYQVPALLKPGSELTAAFDKDGTLNRDVLAKFADVRGIRIEDDVLCTTGEPDVMTGDLPKTVAAIEGLVAGA